MRRVSVSGCHYSVLLSLLLLAAMGCSGFKSRQNPEEVSVQKSLREVQHFMTSDFSDIEKKIGLLSKKYAVGKVLVVFDMDNTLLTMKTDLGSDHWFSWQEQMLLDDVDNATQTELVASDFQALLDIQGLLYNLGAMEFVEKRIHPIMQRLRREGYPMFVLTSRGQAFRYDSLVELLRNGLQFKNNAPRPVKELVVLWKPYDPLTVSADYGFSQDEIKRFKLDLPPREVSYLDGIFLTEGQHKGVMLRIFLKKFNLSPRAIVFIDDKSKHTERVQEVFLNSDIEVVTFQYTRLDGRVSKFLRSGKSMVSSEWHSLQNAFQSGDLADIRKTVNNIFGR